MNNLEFIEKEIKELKFQINYIKSNMKRYIDFRTEGQLEIDMKQFKLNHFQQIKSKLEAWEVVKKCLCIDTDAWDKYSDSFNYIKFTVASIHPLLGFSRQEIESIKKALEVGE